MGIYQQNMGSLPRIYGYGQGTLRGHVMRQAPEDGAMGPSVDVVMPTTINDNNKHRSHHIALYTLTSIYIFNG